MLEGNAEAIETWNTILFDKYTRFREVLVNGFARRHGDHALELHAPQPGWRVVDIGCGFGDTTIDLAHRVGPTGVAVGIDAATRFIEAGRKDAAGIDNVRFEVADVEEAVPGGPYDLAFSRTGMMFFASPVFALRNVRKALRPGGKLCMVVWRNKDANEGFSACDRAVRELLGDPSKGDQITCGPGPFSMASADVVSDQLAAAGYRGPTFTRCDALMQLGRDLDEAVQFALALGPAGEVMRLAGEAAIARRGEIEASLRAVLQPWLGPDGVWMPSSTWIVTATAP